MSILGDAVILGSGGGSTASIFVTGVAQSDTVSCTKGSKSYNGIWTTKTVITEQALIPTMTSNTTPSGIVSTNYPSTTHLPYYAFDGDDTTVAFINTAGSSASNEYLQYEFASSQTNAKRLYCVIKSVGGSTMSGNLVFSVSADGSTWTTVHTESISITGQSVSRTIDISINVNQPKYIRITGSTIYNNLYMLPNIVTVQIYGDVSSTVGGWEFANLNEYGTYTIASTGYTSESVLVDMATEFDIELEAS